MRRHCSGNLGARPRDVLRSSHGTAASARLFMCAECHAQALNCSCCDRGQIYCAGDCAARAGRCGQSTGSDADPSSHRSALRGRRTGSNSRAEFGQLAWVNDPQPRRSAANPPDPVTGAPPDRPWVECISPGGVTIVVRRAVELQPMMKSPFDRPPPDRQQHSFRSYSKRDPQLQRYKYHYSQPAKASIMNTTDDQREPTDDGELETQRSIIRRSLDEIANELGIAMRAANMTYSIGLAVPISGEALVTMVTPVDPSDDDWSRATAIVRQIVAKRLGGIRLRSRPLTCAMANAPMNAAEITRNTLEFDTRS
jgi:hypothetical protein